MTKIIITGDLHWRATNPRGRTDNYQAALTEKVLEVFHLARNYQAEAIIIPGDICDSPNLAWMTIAALVKLFSKSPCPILTIPGNHDLYGGNYESKYRTPYGLLSHIGVIWDLAHEPWSSRNGWINVSGHSYSASTDTPEGAYQFQVPEVVRKNSDGGVMVHVVHSMLLTKSPDFSMRHTLVEDVETDAHLVVSGHDHTGFGWLRAGSDLPSGWALGSHFLNPGALCRLSATKSEMSRQVNVYLVDVVLDRSKLVCDLKYKPIPLLSAKPGTEVLSREHLEEAAARADRIQDFLNLLAQEGESKFLEIREIIEDIAERDALPKDVQAEALTRLGRAQELVGRSAGKC